MIEESRLIPATAALIEGWTGPVWWLDRFRDDTERAEVRDLLLRVWRSSTGERMPEWARDEPGACWWMARAGRVLKATFSGWLDYAAVPGRHARFYGNCRIDVHETGWEIHFSDPTLGFGVVARGPETGDLGKLAADRAALEHGLALLDSDGTLTLPPLVAGGEVVRWPGGAS